MARVPLNVRVDPEIVGWIDSQRVNGETRSKATERLLEERRANGVVPPAEQKPRRSDVDAIGGGEGRDSAAKPDKDALIAAREVTPEQWQAAYVAEYREIGNVMGEATRRRLARRNVAKRLGPEPKA